MGGYLVFLTDGGSTTQTRPIMENLVAPKFSKPVRMLNSFTWNFSGKALSFEWIFCMTVQNYHWNLKFWLLMAFGFRSSLQICVPWSQAYIFLKFKAKSSLHQYADMSDININPKSLYIYIIYTSRKPTLMYVIAVEQKTREKTRKFLAI